MSTKLVAMVMILLVLLSVTAARIDSIWPLINVNKELDILATVLSIA